MTKKEPNYKAFIPIGITFMGAGVALMAAINPGVGVGLIGVGVVFLIIGIKKTREEDDK
jgi:hypothetical protein